MSSNQDARRYIFIRDNGKVAFTSNFMVGSFTRATMRNATHVQDRETGERYHLLHSGPMIDRLRKTA